MSIAPWWCLIMPDQEQPIELRPARAVERGHLLVGQHARHQHVVLHAVHLHLVARRRRVGHGLAAIAQPGLHHRDLVALADDDALAEDRDVLARAVRRRPAGHDHGLRVMRNHARHEVHVGVGVGKRPSPGGVACRPGRRGRRLGRRRTGAPGRQCRRETGLRPARPAREPSFLPG